MYKKLSALLLLLAVFLAPAVASAHVIVTPGQTGIGEELTFNISVPNEQQTPVVDLKLDIPSGVMNVVPTATPGWTITTSDNGNTQNPVITAITWSRGSIAVGQREDFTFSAQVPATATELDWKAYQTYADGTVVHWDQKPAGSDDSTGNAGPYSITKVVNDLTATPATTTSNVSKSTVYGSYALAAVALVVAVSDLLITKRRK